MNTDYVPAQTSAPDWLMTYCRQLSEVHHQRRLNRMYVYMLEAFLAYEPWKSVPPFEWRQARIHAAIGALERKETDLGWVPMNMVLPNLLFARIKQTIEYINTYDTTSKHKLSMRTFLYTAVCWWCSAVHPYDGPGIISN